MRLSIHLILLCFAAVLTTAGAHAQQPQATPSPETAPPPNAEMQRTPPPTVDLDLKVELEPQAIELLKAASRRLASAKTMTFTAVTTYESLARTGEPLAYTTLSQVTMQRPDKLRVVTPADGPRSEFYYDGKQMIAFEPEAGLAAVADAPSTIDAMLKTAFDNAGIYFPFTDFIVTDPYQDIAGGLKLAFVVGQSHVVGGTTTDIVAFATSDVQVELWIGAQDKLPRMARATYFDEPNNYRHVLELSNWELDGAIPAGAFSSATAQQAKRIRFEHPEAAAPPAK